MSNVTKNDGDWEPSSYLSRVGEMASLSQLFSYVTAENRNRLVHVYGPEALSVCEDDERLVSCMRSGDPALQRMALDCMLHIRYLFDYRIVLACADYIIQGEHQDIRLNCIIYLSVMSCRDEGKRVSEVLRECAEVLRNAAIPARDDLVTAFLNACIERTGMRDITYEHMNDDLSLVARAREQLRVSGQSGSDLGSRGQT